MSLLFVGLLLAGCGSTVGSAASPRSRGEPSPSAPATSPASVRTPARFTTERCAGLVVLGLRGQGQSVRSNRGVGHEVLLSVRALVRRLSDTTVRLQAVRYPSGSNASYDADVDAGVRMVSAATDELASACPDSRIALFGYSQGAEVVHLAAARSPYPLAVLMGDPLRNPRLDVRTLSFGDRLEGRGNAGYGSAFTSPAGVVEVCARADNVCNAPLAGRVGPVSATHRELYERVTAARRVAVVAAQVVGAAP